MTKKQFILWTIQVLLFTALGSLQFVEPHRADAPDSLGRHLAHLIYDNRLLLSILLGFLAAGLAGWGYLYAPRRRTREIRLTALETLRLELLNNDHNNYRITVFKEANYFRRMVIYGRLFIKSLKNRKNDRKKRRKFTLPKRGRYIIVWHRLGTEHEKSKTFFYCPRHTISETQGVAGAAMQSLTDIVADNLPDIANVDLSSVDLTKLQSPTTRAVAEYMRKGYIKDFDTLKRLNKRARHIYGNVLQDSSGEPKGVLVIDSFLGESFLTEDVIRKLGHYVTVIGATM